MQSDTAPQAHLSIEADASADTTRDIRARLRMLLEMWQLEPRVASAVVDVTHELLVNAHQHGAPPVHVTVTADPAEVRVSVQDGNTAPARLLPYRPGVSERGLGLQLVRQLSSEWGQTSRTGGKTVWAVFVRRSSQSG
jgi:two-component sensor histidine kinase